MCGRSLGLLTLILGALACDGASEAHVRERPRRPTSKAERPAWRADEEHAGARGHDGRCPSIEGQWRFTYVAQTTPGRTQCEAQLEASGHLPPQPADVQDLPESCRGVVSGPDASCTYALAIQCETGLGSAPSRVAAASASRSRTHQLHVYRAVSADYVEGLVQSHASAESAGLASACTSHYALSATRVR